MPSPMPQEDQASWRLATNPNSQLTNTGQDFLADDMARLNIDSDRSKNTMARFPEANGPTKPSDPDSQPVHSRSPSGAGRLTTHPAPSSGSASPARGQAQADPALKSTQSDQPSYPSLSNTQRGPNSQKSHGNSNQANGRPFRGAPPGFGSRNPQYRVPQQIQVGMPQQGLIPSPTGMAYPGNHSAPISLGTPQQLFDMMGVPVDPALPRVPPQNNIRVNHQHSTSDPPSVHDSSNLPPMSSNMQSFSPPMFTPQIPGPLSMYPNQFYPSQEAYRADLAAQAQAMLAARLQQQYPNQYGSAPNSAATDQSMVSPSSSNGQGSGPSANNRKLGLYKTELCRSWEEKHSCRYGAKCQFAHGEEELRAVQRHPKYKTEICRTFWVSGSCPYGKRCCFIHTELPHGTAAPNGNTPTGQSNESSSPPVDNRPRSQSNSSDPADAQKSLLARISTGGDPSTPDSNPTTPTPIDTSSATNFPFSARPPTGSLRVDTKSLDTQAYKTQNKSAFPVFPNSRTVQPAPEPVTAKSPIPVTAGPDFGRHTASRIEIVGQNTHNGASTPTNGGHSYSSSTDEGSTSTAHQRASSGSAWGQNARAANATANYPASPATENITSPWTTQELVTGGSRQRPW